MKDKILFISPKYPPLMDGLAGHSFHLTRELSKFYSIDFLTDKKICFTGNSPVNLMPFITKWKFLDLKNNYNLNNNSYKHIFIQYVPSLYASRGGINFSILLFFIYLRFIKKEKISIMFHELFYPLEWHWKAFILHICHKVMLFVSINCAQISFFSTQRYKLKAKYFSLFSKKLIHLPVGASIETRKTVREMNNEITTYIIFGDSHPSKRYDLIFNSFEKAFIANVEFKLVIIGTNLKKLETDFDLPSHFSKYTTILDKLEDQIVIDYFEKADYLVSYFSDGLTTRRSSVISALANDLPIISSQSIDTDVILTKTSAIILFPVQENLYEQKMVEFIKNPQSIDIGIARNFYDRYLSWEKIASTINEHWA